MHPNNISTSPQVLHRSCIPGQSHKVACRSDLAHNKCRRPGLQYGRGGGSRVRETIKVRRGKVFTRKASAHVVTALGLGNSQREPEGLLSSELRPEMELEPVDEHLLGPEVWEEEEELLRVRARAAHQPPASTAVLPCSDVLEAARRTPSVPRPRQRGAMAYAAVGLVAVVTCVGALVAGTRGRLGPSHDPLPAAYTSTTGPSTMLGHRRMEQAPFSDLCPVSPGSGVLLRPSAALAFVEMQAAAKLDGVTLVPVSGFRSVEDQRALFFGVKADRAQSVAERAQVSAPPGYSEHHTGYALDIASDEVHGLNEEFDMTEAFFWLQDNSHRFHWEMSYPRNNPAGVAYEPWHYRYMGDSLSLSLFHDSSTLA